MKWHSICSDLQNVTLQVTGTYRAKDVSLQKHLAKVKELAKDFMKFEVKHVPREQNVRADILSKLASIKLGSNNIEIPIHRIATTGFQYRIILEVGFPYRQISKKWLPPRRQKGSKENSP